MFGYHGEYSWVRVEWDLTNDEVNLRTEVELEERVTHEVNHLDPFYDPHCRNTLAYVQQFVAPLFWISDE